VSESTFWKLTIDRGITAGMVIGLCSIIYLRVPNHVVGAALFSLGLLYICTCNKLLFTGSIGFAKTKDEWIQQPIILTLNIVGVMIVWLIFSTIGSIDSSELYAVRTEIPLWEVLVRAIGCGMLMYVAVSTYKRNRFMAIFVIPLCIMSFILAGFFHSIADIMYYALYRGTGFVLEPTWYLTLIGNIGGARLLALFDDFKYKKKEVAKA